MIFKSGWGGCWSEMEKVLESCVGLGLWASGTVTFLYCDTPSVLPRANTSYWGVGVLSFYESPKPSITFMLILVAASHGGLMIFVIFEDYCSELCTYLDDPLSPK